MRIAVLADVHGNLPALEAVLAALDDDPVDAIAVAGDLLGGPYPAEVLAALRGRPEPVHWVSGNAERETVAVYDGGAPADGAPGRAAAWSAAALTAEDRDAIAAWPIALTLSDVCVCHGSPRRDDEMITRLSPPEVLDAALADVPQALVVGGHTHQQMVRARSDDAGADYVNAGSVGVPYEGEPGAFWLLVDGGVPELRRTAYDIEAALVRLRASGYPQIDEMLEGSLYDCEDPGWVSRLFEHMAGRGANPGSPPRRRGQGERPAP